MNPPDRSPSPGAFDAILFDLDGTLADSAADIRNALQHAFGVLGVAPRQSLDVLVDGSPLEEVFAVAVPSGTSDQLEQFVVAYRSHYMTENSRQTRLYPGVRETLDVLASMRPRLKLAVATSKRESTAREVVEALQIGNLFDMVAGSGARTIRPKPSPDLLLEIALQLEVDPSRILMVGDTLRDVVAGQRAGMKTAAVTYGLGSADALMEARPDYLLEEFDELLFILGLQA